MANDESSQLPEASAPARGFSKLTAWWLGAWHFPGPFFWTALLFCLLVCVPVWQGGRALWAALPVGWDAVKPHLPELFSNTLGLAAAVALAGGCLGVGLAWLVALCEFPGRRLFGWALLLPLAMPPYVLGFTLLGLCDADDGAVYAAWLAWQGEAAGFPQVRSMGGLVLSLSLSLYPYVYLSARDAFLVRSGHAMEIARSLGAGPYAAFFRVGLPVAWPWIGAGLVLVAAESLADVGTVVVFHYETLATAVVQAWVGPSASFAVAARWAGFLLLPALAVLALGQWFHLGQNRRAGPAGLVRRRRLRGGARRGFCHSGVATDYLES